MSYKKTRRRKYIKNKAQEILSLSVNKSPFALADALGIRISEIPSSIPGFISGKTIYINNSLDTYSKKIVCAHELGHYILHFENDLDLFDMTGDSYGEYEANLFACFIFPQILARADKNCINSIKKLNEYVENHIIYLNNQ